ncbi:tetratricopeptide repeat protein [Alteromonas gracilis]|uniref:tetratricopeptide repeat protein n=1 Tax=Alteromonas gracilis TaxID=1479524 RepID=UPI003735A08A
MTRFKKITAVTLFGFIASSLAFVTSVDAKITVELEEPDWQFVLRQHHKDGHHERISREEGEFVKQIQGDLQAGNFSRVASAFEAQDVSRFSPRLRELYGQVLLNEKNYALAEQVLLGVIKAIPNLPSAHRSLSMVYLMTDKLAKARIHLTKSVELGIQDAQLFGQLAYANLQLGKPVTALSAYQNALMLEPNSKQWSQGLLFALIESNALAQAESLLGEMLIDDENNPQLWLQRGQIALKQGNMVKALASLETALSLGDSSLSNLISVAKLHVSDGSAKRAADILAKHAKTFTLNKEGFDAFSQIATYLAANEQWSDLSKLIQAAESNVNNFTTSQVATLNVLKAQLAISKGQNKTAISLLTKAIDEAPDHGEALLQLASLYRKQNNIERAKMTYLRAEALTHVKQQAMLGRAQIAIDQRQYQHALSLLRQVYKSYPSRSDLLSNIQPLENLVKNAI